MPPIGAHMSIAGGVENAPARAAAVGCTALQIFVKNNNRWEGPPISKAQESSFPAALKQNHLDIKNVFAHTGYLINLASPKEDVVEKSIRSLQDELTRCEQLGLPGIVMHPGSHVGTGAEKGLDQIVELTELVFSKTPNVRTRLLFENTAGTGSTLGGPFEELAYLLNKISDKKRIGVCLDTCHMFAFGYDIRTEEGFKKTFAEFDRVVGFKWLKAMHLNDSKHPLGSRKDRHEHLGQGHIGTEPFRQLMIDPRFAKIPMSIETEKGDDLAEDKMNLDLLRGFMAEGHAA